MTKPEIYQLSVGTAFDSLRIQEKLYAHYMARATWNGTRIILRQVSPEANGIFDFIMVLYHHCEGNWESLAKRVHVDPNELERFLDYCAMFLSNIGNYFGSGDQKFIPDISEDSLVRLASASPLAAELLNRIKDPLFQKYPNTLGTPSELAQSTYYLGDNCLDTPEDVSAISTLMGERSIFPENTRLKRHTILEGVSTYDTYDILQASVTKDEGTCLSADRLANSTMVRLVKGDHREELQRICENLQKAQEYASNHAQREMLQKIEESFYTGDLEPYRRSQRVWVKDKAPTVESVIGFIEPYRDPMGVRAEYEGIVGVADPVQTHTLNVLASMANQKLCELPWAEAYTGKSRNGPFEKELFDPPDFASVQSLAYCSSIVFPGINLPNYNDIRQEVGFKNIIFANRMVAESQRARGIHMVVESERPIFQKYRFHAYYLWVVLHEILGHGTGKLLMENPQGNFNFDPNEPPLNPLTGKPIESWYLPGQTWTSVFEDLATTVDECRAELVGAYMVSDADILNLFGYTSDGKIKQSSVIYNMYLQLGVDGLRALENYNPSSNKWGQAHSRAHFAIFKHLLRDCPGLFTVDCDLKNMCLTVKANESLVMPNGKESLGRMLLKLHIYRCTADIKKCREFYEDLSRVDDEALNWRKVVLAKKDPPLAFCHANTYIVGEEVKLKEYKATTRGLIQSWAERFIV